MDFSTLILAGGRSRRMGQPKAFLPIQGETLLERAVRIAQELNPAEVLIAGRAGLDYPAMPGCTVVLDREPDLGPLGGIERGLASSRSPLLMVLAVDLPHMTAAFLRRLLALCDPTTGSVPRLDGRLEPLAAVYPASSHRLADRLLVQRQLAARAFANACLLAQIVRILELGGNETGLFRNWNTPADVAAGNLAPSLT
jgi:molybdenum cofactor guanylyltransferase